MIKTKSLNTSAFLILALCSSFLKAELEVEGYLGLEAQKYSKKENKHSSNLSFEQEIKFTYETDDFTSVLELFAQEDSSDFSSKQDNERSFVRINEFYTSYESDDYSIIFGKNIRFWGALEVNNIVDTFNIQDSRNDSFTTDKIGAYNITYSHFFEDSELNIITKLYEQNNEMADSSYIYSILSENESFNDKLQSDKSLHRPSLYLAYNGTAYGDEYSLDYALIYENGFDSQRYFTKDGSTYTQNAYLVNKFMTYNTLVFDSTLYKLEALYTDVINNEYVSDYIHLGLGVEHTLDAFENGHELGLLAEYYYYDTFEENKTSDISLGESFQNDLFLGFRYSFNDIDDSSIVSGVILDRQYDEQSYFLEYETRVFDMLKITLDYRYIEPSETYNTVFASLETHQRLALNISYHF